MPASFFGFFVYSLLFITFILVLTSSYVALQTHARSENSKLLFLKMYMNN